MKIILTLLVIGLLSSFGVCDSYDMRPGQPGTDARWSAIRLEDLDLSKMSQSYGEPHAKQSIVDKPLRMNGQVYENGVGSHAQSVFPINLKGKAEQFLAMVGVDDAANGQGSVIFRVLVDGKEAASTPVMHGGDKPICIDVLLKGAKRMLLLAEDAGDGIGFDHADWASAVIFVSGTLDKSDYPEAMAISDDPPMPIAHFVADRPSINGPSIIGATPSRPFLFLIPATGKGPLTYSAKNLPPGLSLDPNTGIISGSLKEDGSTPVALTVKGPRGIARRMLTIVGGDHKLALTPPMGWNSWYVWCRTVDDQKMRDAADQLVKTGLAGHGYQYVNIDDCWEGGRNAKGEILGNEKFPDMRALADYIHAKGLKFGVYSSPGPKTCAGFEGSYGHEKQDAATYAKWGVDFFKGDWCSYKNIAKDRSLPEMQKPYRVMRVALDGCGRDVVYSLCQYGMGDVWNWGQLVGANMWRTTGDTSDNWAHMSGIGFSQRGHEVGAGPGHWNDLDMLMFGGVGFGNLHPSRLTPNEKITHMTLWCLLTAPLLIGGDIARLDQFEMDLLTNDEVIAVDQDPLGKQAKRVSKEGMLDVWAKPMSDGSIAVGLFNRDFARAKVTVTWSDLGISGRQPVRDLWRHKDLGNFDGSFSAETPSHGAVLVRIGG